MHPRPPSSTLFPYTTLFRSVAGDLQRGLVAYAAQPNAALCLVDTETGRERVLTGSPYETSVRIVAFAPDRRHAIVATFGAARSEVLGGRRIEEGEVLLVDLEGESEHVVGTITAGPTDVSWSDEGDRVLVATDEALHVMEPSSGRVRQIRVRTRSGVHALASFSGSEAVVAVDATAWRRFSVPAPALTEPRANDAIWIAGATGGAMAWLTESGRAMLQPPGEQPRENGRHEGAAQIAIGSEPDSVVTVGADGVRRFGARADWLLQAPIPMLHSMRLSARGEHLAIRRID